MKKAYKIIISYDGTNYQGWQEQKNAPTIAGTLKKTFNHVFKKEMSLVGASRTDGGVHALGQVARFWTDVRATPEQLHAAWSNKLPEDIVLVSLEESPIGFHPQHNVYQKTYFYHITFKRPTPLAHRSVWFYPYAVNIEKLQKCLQVFVGTHDFRSFCSGHDSHNGTIRTIDEAYVMYLPELDMYRIVIKGPSFLRYMIRRIVGASIEVASRDFLPVEHLSTILKEKNPQQILPNAPAKGLMLYKIDYKE